MRVKGAHSERWRVSMHPLMTLTSTRAGDGSVTITVAVQGGRAGDAVHLLLPKGEPALVASAVLGNDGSAGFQVAPPERRVRYVVYLDQTATAHRRTRGDRGHPAQAMTPDARFAEVTPTRWCRVACW